MLLGSTLLAQGEPLDREKWVGQTGRANRICLAKFRQKFGGAKDHIYATCMADQTNKEIETCTGNGEFSNCVTCRNVESRVAHRQTAMRCDALLSSRSRGRLGSEQATHERMHLA